MVFEYRFANDTSYFYPTFEEFFTPKKDQYSLNIATCYCTAYLNSLQMSSLLNNNMKVDMNLVKSIDFTKYNHTEEC